MFPKLGETASIIKEITDKSIQSFAEATGDFNPIHFDDKVAQDQGFDRRIAHGMLIGSFVSSLLANQLPGPGTIYLGQTFKFMGPVYVNDEIQIRIEVIKIRDDKPIITLSTVGINEKRGKVFEGEAVVMLKVE